MQKNHLFFFIGLLVFSGFGYKLSAQDNYEIRKVSFHGNRTLKDGFLLEGMGIKVASGFDKLISKKEATPYKKEGIDIALDHLKLIYQGEGFLDMKASLRPLEIDDKKQTVKLIIDIEEGKPVLIDSVIIREKDHNERVKIDSLKRKLLRRLELNSKKRFRDMGLRFDIQTIGDAYRKRGYAYVEVNYDLKLNPEQHLTTIIYSINPGLICSFGETTISGNKHITEAFLRKQLRYKEGGVYNKSILNDTRKNLYLLQLFRVASLVPETEKETQRNPIPVKMYIQEAPRLTTNFGLGYGTEDKFRTYVDMTYKGFFGTARRLNLHLKHSFLEPYTINLSWIQPQFFTPKSSIALNPFLTRIRQPAINTRSFGINIPVTYQFNDLTNASIVYYLENVKQYVEPGDSTLPGREDRNFPYNKSGIIFNASFNNSNPRFSPRGGENLMIGLKVNGYLFGSEFNYTRLWVDYRIYREAMNVIIAYRIMAGGIHSGDISQFIPVEDRFYSGGSNSIRGWYLQQLGPKRSSGSPLGGKSVIETNLEFRFPLFWKLNGVAFLDAGNVWTGSYSYHLDDLSYAAGPGLRIETPIGPVRFDVGFPLWNEKKKPQFFISVGQAF